MRRANRKDPNQFDSDLFLLLSPGNLKLREKNHRCNFKLVEFSVEVQYDALRKQQEVLQMKLFLRSLCCFLLAGVLLLPAGCGAKNSHHYEKSYVIFREPGKADLIDKDGYKTEKDGVTYCFTNKVEKAERDRAVDEISQMIEGVGEKLGIPAVSAVITIKTGAYAPGIYKGVLYSGITDLRTQNFAASLVQFLLGTHVSYSLCYALGTELAQTMGYTVEDLPAVEEAITLCETSPLHLDMNYACFLPCYSDQETLPKVKALALDFYLSLTAEAKQELLMGYTNVLFRRYFNDYLTANGQEGIERSGLEDISFYPCSGDVRIAWEDPYSCFYLFDSFTVKRNDLDRLKGSEDLTNSGYKDFRYLVSCYWQQAAEAEKMMGYLESAGQDQKPNVFFMCGDRYDHSIDGVYLEHSNEIRIYNVMTYMHEYTHYLTRGGTKTAWLQELLANYATMRTGHEDLYWDHLWFKAACTDPDSVGDNAGTFQEFYGKVEAHLGRSFDWNSQEDVKTFFNARIVNNQIMDLVTDLTQTFTKASLVQYLTTLVGEETALQAIYEDTPMETFGKNWGALVEDWTAWISSEYAWILA